VSVKTLLYRKTAKFEIEKQCLEPRPERGVGQGTFSMPLGGGSVGVLGADALFIWWDSPTHASPSSAAARAAQHTQTHVKENYYAS
jgi:hypothetical protein